MKKYSMMTFPLKTYLPPLVTRIPATPETFVLGYYFLGKLGFHSMTVFFNLAFLLPLKGEFDLEKMRESIQVTIEEEPVLKSCLMKDKEGFWLVEREQYHPEIPYIYAEGRNWKEREAWVDSYAQECAKEDYNLFNPDIDQSRFIIIKVSENKHYLLFLGIHIFYDYGAATSVFSKVFDHYENGKMTLDRGNSFGEFLEEETAFIQSKVYQYIAYREKAGSLLKKSLPMQRDFSP